VKSRLCQLSKMIGSEYKELDNNGNYVGCFSPMYVVVPDAPRFELPRSEDEFFDFAFDRLLEVFAPSCSESLVAGDILVFEL